ncbi:MAG: class I SAM-dependent methyltransferase [Actinomycetota bacterium]|nr:class I SAM-dependent methyltransferase [Actinomycetota bacterium]
MNAFTNRETLRTSAYVDDAKLADRQAIYRFVERPWPSSRGRVLGAIDLDGDETVIDVGCGNGRDGRQLLAANHAGPIIGFDLSVGMLRMVVGQVPAVNADVAALPLRDGAADVALASHMLYHCPDLPAAVAELRGWYARAVRCSPRPTPTLTCWSCATSGRRPSPMPRAGRSWPGTGRRSGSRSRARPMSSAPPLTTFACRAQAIACWCPTSSR